MSISTTFHEVAAKVSTAALAPLAALQAVHIPDVNAASALATGTSLSADASRAMTLASRPATAAANAVRISPLKSVANFLGKALPIVAIGANSLVGAAIVDDKGARALIDTKEGRGAVLGALGGALFLIPTPATQLGAAGVLTLAAVNEFNGLKRFDRPVATTTATGTTSPASSTATTYAA